MTAPERRLHPSRAARAALVVAGTIALVVGLAGLFLPVVPTTPLLLVAAACYARASTRLHGALVRSRLFGPTLREWESTRTVPVRTKVVAIGMMAATLAASIVFAVDHPFAEIALVAVGVAVASWIASLPSRRAEAGR